MFELSLILLLILFNALFVASEFATVVAPKLSIEKLALEGNRTAKQIYSVIKEPLLQDRYIAASQVGITAASLALGMYGEQVIATWIIHYLHLVAPLEITTTHAIASALSLTLLTYLHIVFGEMIPKSLALQKSEAVMFFLIGPMLFFMRVFRPIIFILNGMNNFLLRNLMGIDRSKSTFPAFSSDEIQLILKESESEGIISDEIGSVIEQLFDFGELVAEDIMVPRVHILAVPIRPTKAQVLEIVRQANHSRYPVYTGDKDNIVGTVHVKDLAAFLEANDDRSLIIRPVPFVPQSSTLQSVLESMRQFRTHLAVVLDEHGGTAGIISIQDIFGEVIGEIDESTTPPPIETIDSKSVRVLGTARLEQLAGYLGLVIEEEDVGTISGLVLDQLGRPPRVGDRFNFKNLSIEVTIVKGRGAQSCIVTVLPDA